MQLTRAVFIGALNRCQGELSIRKAQYAWKRGTFFELRVYATEGAPSIQGYKVIGGGLIPQSKMELPKGQRCKWASYFIAFRLRVPESEQPSFLKRIEPYHVKRNIMLERYWRWFDGYLIATRRK